MKHWVRLVLVLMTMPVLCSAQQPETTPPVPVPAEPAKKMDAAPPVVTLIEPGAQPRQALRLKPAVGAAQDVQLRVVMGLSMKVEGQGEFSISAMPAMVMTLTLKAISVSAEGDAAYDIAFGSCGVDGGEENSKEMVEMMKAAIAPLSGVTGSGVMTSRGIVNELKLKQPGNLDQTSAGMFDNMKQQMGQMGIPLPEDAVGAGARWTVKTQVNSDGLVIDQVQTVELVSVKDDVATLKLSTEQKAAAGQTMKMPGVSAGAPIPLESFKSTGHGEVEQPLNSLAPRTAKTKIVTDLTAAVPQKDQARKMAQRVTIEVSLSPGAAVQAPADPPAK